MADKSKDFDVLRAANRAAEHFAVKGAPADAERHGSGHINDTFLKIYSLGGLDSNSYILQRINRKVLTDPVAHLENALKVIEHIESKEPDERRRIGLVRTKDNRPFWRDEDGEYWRMFCCDISVVTRDTLESPDQAYQAAKTFGTFIDTLKDLSPAELKTTFPYFHDTPKRFLKFESAIAADARNRAAGAKDAVEFALKRKEMIGVLAGFSELGELSERIVHNDTKVNNVLFDR
ncbi:MAG: phosphotransferase, partial [Planctomycetes bacterium]|nr:phosphotransferase [Planctomycetota bacterium]